MIDIGWQELFIIGTVLILVVGPKDLPRVLRTFGQWMGQLRGLANSFQRQINVAAQHADITRDIKPLQNPTLEAVDTSTPTEQAAREKTVREKIVREETLLAENSQSKPAQEKPAQKDEEKDEKTG